MDVHIQARGLEDIESTLDEIRTRRSAGKFPDPSKHSSTTVMSAAKFSDCEEINADDVARVSMKRNSVLDYIVAKYKRRVHILWGIIFSCIFLLSICFIALTKVDAVLKVETYIGLTVAVIVLAMILAAVIVVALMIWISHYWNSTKEIYLNFLMKSFISEAKTASGTNETSFTTSATGVSKNPPSNHPVESTFYQVPVFVENTNSTIQN